VPDTVTLSTQQKQVVLMGVTLTSDLIKQIKKASPHIRLINTRVVDKIRKEYSVSDELGLGRENAAAEPGAVDKFTTYNKFTKNCIAWGAAEKAKLGLTL